MSPRTRSSTRNQELEMPTAICLRFRNKGVPDTIAEHKEIIKNSDRKYVWWGWWAKKYENAPQLITAGKIDATSIAIYLINPRDEKYYQAKGVQFFTSPNGEEDRCPNLDQAPEYYRDMNLKFWLKISDIREMQEDEIKSFFTRYSFCHVREHLTDENVGFRDIDFNNRQANCIEAFTMQEVSIWFLRDRIDKDKQVSKLSVKIWRESKQRQTNFPKQAYRTKSDKIMILSDLHFGSHHAFQGNIGEFKSLTEAIKKMPEESRRIGENANELYSGLIISGDFTWAAESDEFKDALTFINELSDYYGFKTKNQLAIVPGNHDIRFREDNEEGPSAPVQIASIGASQNYRDFYKNVYDGLTPERNAFCMGRRIETRHGLIVEIICLDSNILQQDKKHFVGQGFVGQHQLDLICREMELVPEESHQSYRILVIHHNILQATYQDEIEPDKSYSVLLDCGRLLTFIKKYRINLVIHGHNHADLVTGITLKKNENKKNDYDHFYHVIAIGSTGLKGCDNAFGELEFQANGNVQYRRRRILVNEKNDSGIENGTVENKYDLGSVYSQQ